MQRLLGVTPFLEQIEEMFRRSKECDEYDKFKKDWYEKLQNSQKHISSNSQES